MTWKRTWQTKKKLFFGRGKTIDAELNKLAKLQQYLIFEIIIKSYSLQLKSNIFKKKTCKLGKNYQIIKYFQLKGQIDHAKGLRP